MRLMKAAGFADGRFFYAARGRNLIPGGKAKGKTSYAVTFG
jgi:hypothetical protein